MTARSAFVGSPATVAETIDRYVQDDAADGYILVPHLTPHGLDRFVDEVVPLLQERGVFRTDYEGPTLRDHLGLARPPGAHRAHGLARSGAARRRCGRSRSPSSAPARRRHRCSSVSSPASPSSSPAARCRCTWSIPTAPAPAGCGGPTSHPLLWMNSMAEDVTMFTDDSVRCAGPIRPGPSLHEWSQEVDDDDARRAGPSRARSTRSAASTA